jgi:prepilin-type N-terminal cleavage/methylation domain-containing protein/prepilin-type processing-associated H-X9-DG protein
MRWCFVFLGQERIYPSLNNLLWTLGTAKSANLENSSMLKEKEMKKKGFTLVELLVVIAIIALLMGILMPALARVRQIAYRLYCGTNLSGIGKAMLIYAGDYDDELPRQGLAYGVVNNVPPTTSGTITSCFYKLVKYAEVTPKSFLCRGDTGVTQFVDSTVDLTDLFDFGAEPTKHCSYTYHDPYPGTAGTGFPLTTSSDPGMAVAGDLSPWFARPERPAYVFPNKTTAYPNGFKPLGSREEIKLGNSWAHQDDGQNILFADGHTNFEKTSACGVNEDNVYTIGDNPMGTVGAPPAAAPASRTDSWLVSDGTGAPKGSRCFPADTIVWVDGEMTQISKVVAGAMVDKPAVTKTITSLQKTVCSNEIEELVVHDDGASWERYDISLENGNSLVVADSHYFLLASGEWVSSLKLEAGSKLQTLEGAVTIKSVVKSATPSTGTVYNLKIKGGDRYLVGKDGIVVRDW